MLSAMPSIRLSTIAIMASAPDVKERHRYALLQAAATIYSGSLVMVRPADRPSEGAPHYWENFETRR